jgi:hypothetical protein
MLCLSANDAAIVPSRAAAIKQRCDEAATGWRETGFQQSEAARGDA